MNAYYENVNIRYNDTTRAHEVPDHRFGDGLISFICAIVGMLTCPVAVKLEKTVLVFALFISFGGVVCAIESGILSMLAGIIICGVISLIEYFTLKSMLKSSKNK